MSNTKQKLAEQFSLIVQKGLYDDADQMLSQLREEVSADEYLSESLCVTAAFLYNRLGKRQDEFYYLEQGFMINPQSPSLFVSLADYYSRINPIQELICLYQAEHYANHTGDKEQADFIRNIINALKKNGVSVPTTSIVILSYNTKKNIIGCLDTIWKTVPLDRCQVIVIDNASTDDSVEYLRTLDWITLVEKDKSSGFSDAYNDGIEKAEKDNDVYLLSPDTIITEDTLFWLKMGLYENNDIASTSSVVFDDMSTKAFETTSSKYNIPMELPYSYSTSLTGTSILLRRTVLDEVGILDGELTSKHSAFSELGLRFLKTGKLNLICKNSNVFNCENASGQNTNDLFNKNDELLTTKLGIDIYKYQKCRTDLVEEIKAERKTKLHILEVNCGIGATAALIKSQYPFLEYKGIEKNDKAATYAMAFGEVITGDIEEVEFGKEFEEYFDYILLGDVLQHTHDPAEVLKKLSLYLKKSGRMIISVPNIRHWSVILPLLNDDRFEYSDDGIINSSCIKFFTENEMARLISGNGFSIKNIKTEISEEPSDAERRYLESLAELSDQNDINDFLVSEYVFTIEKRR